MKLIFSILAVALLAHAGTVTISWAPMPVGQKWTAVRIYERTGAAAPYTYQKVAEVTADKTSATITDVAPGVHTYVARSVAGWESIDSEPSTTPPAPDPPKLTVTVTVNP